MNLTTIDTQTAFVTAACGYFGIPLDQLVMGSQVDLRGCTFDLVLRVALTPDDMIAIVKRMEQSRQDAQALGMEQAQEGPASGAGEAIALPTYEELVRHRGRFLGDPRMQVATMLSKLDAWSFDYDNMTEGRAAYGSRFNYLLDQARQADIMVLQEAERPAVTSNADDFGGLPG